MSKIKLLLVDDEEDYVRTMAERLEMRDVASRVALSGEEALQLVKEDTPDVMVLDLRMPGINGMEVLEQVKKQHPHVQVIILTGHGSEKDEQEARRLGAFEYLQKPADTNQLLRTVRSAWRKSIALLKESKEEFERTMVAAALAEEGLHDDVARERVRDTSASQGDAVAARGTSAEAGRGGHGIRVLFVDDEEDFVRTMAERMELRDVGGEVALGGQQALERLERELPDVMVLDLRMPDIDGMEVLRRVKTMYPQLEVIILTGHGSEQDEQEARRLGAFAYLRKPVNTNELIEVVRRAAHVRGKTR